MTRIPALLLALALGTSGAAFAASSQDGDASSGTSGSGAVHRVATDVKGALHKLGDATRHVLHKADAALHRGSRSGQHA